MAKPLTILILNWNGLDDTVACIDSLLADGIGDAHIAVVDNGSRDAEAAALRERYQDCSALRVYENKSNLGFTRGVNQFIEHRLEHRGVGWLVLLNNDTVVEPGWLSSLADCAERESADVVASRMIRFDDHQRLDNAGHIMLNTGEILPRGVDRLPQEYSDSAEVLGACAGAALYSLSMLEDIGLFDEFFDTGYEDAELGLRAVLAGYRTIYEPKAMVYHHVSRSLNKVRDFEYAVGIQRNINYTMLKLLPWQLLTINLPFIVAKQLSILVVALVTFRWRLFKAHSRALAQTMADRETIVAARRRASSLRRIGWLALMKRQKFFLGTYWRYFVSYILRGKKTVFER